LSFAATTFAATPEMNRAANELYSKGLFGGTGTDVNGNPTFELDRAPTRQEAVTMLVNLLGKAEEARNGIWEMPFTDVADWAKPYVGYAYTNGLASGMSAKEFGANQPITATQYITYVLRALGYEVGVDFQWDKAWELSDEIGLTDGRYRYSKHFVRGDAALISYNSLYCGKKGEFPFPIPEETEQQKKDYYRLQESLRKNIFTKDIINERTLTWDEARALADKDLETVKKYVKTVYDMAYYLYAAGYKVHDYGDLSLRNGEITWHFNYAPHVIYELREGNCGGYSGLAAYLLEGDYDEVGCASMNARMLRGGHVINYIKKGNLYFTFDTTQLVSERGLGLCSGTDLNDVVTMDVSNRKKENMVACTYKGDENGDMPKGWPHDVVYYFIDGYCKDDINIVFEKEDYKYKYIEIKQEVYDKIIEMKNSPQKELHQSL